jgi:hypothetical protein
MKKKIILLIASSLLILSCEQNLCDKGYKPHKQNGQTIYSWLLNGKVLDPKLGNTYYRKYGVVTIKMEYGRCKQHNNWKYW